MTRKVCITPTSVAEAKCFIRIAASGEPIIAPPPKPMIAMPVAMPRRSGNHLISVDTGEMYPSPSPTPPITPEPSSMIQNWCAWMPKAEITMPPHQQTAATTPALRGPTRSSQPPHSAAEQPRMTKNRVNIQPSVETCQSQVVVVSCAKKPTSLGQAREVLMPSALLSGSQNTENP